MIILHSQKIVLFRVPKTGSTSMQHDIVHSDLYDSDIDIITPEIEGSTIQKLHTTPQIAYDNGYITDDMIENYKMYAVIRNPNDRLMSAMAHVIRPARISTIRISRRLIARGVNTLPNIFKLPQKTWFYINDVQVVTPILYDNLDEEFTEIFGIEKMISSPLNQSFKRASTDDVFCNEDITTLVAEYYSDDWVLYNTTADTDLSER